MSLSISILLFLKWIQDHYVSSASCTAHLCLPFFLIRCPTGRMAFAYVYAIEQFLVPHFWRFWFLYTCYAIFHMKAVWLFINQQKKWKGFICLSICLFVCPSIHSSIHLSNLFLIRDDCASSASYITHLCHKSIIILTIPSLGNHMYSSCIIPLIVI